MEIFDPSDLRSKAYRSAIVQKGGALEMDRYIYGMQGEGLGNWFGSIMKQAIPLIGSAIKGASNVVKPIAIAAGKEILTTGAKRGAEELTKRITTTPKNTKNKVVVHRPHKKRKRTNKWHGL